jgi:hypothetical protein
VKYFKYAKENIPCDFERCKCPASKGDKKFYSFVYSKDRFIYYSIPKCASTTIIKSFFDSPNFSMIDPKSDIDYFRFTFIRNPFSRLVSNYSMFTQQKKRVRQIGRTFENFEEFVLFIRDNNNHHWQPMNLFLPDTLDFVGKVENFEKDFNILCNLLDLKLNYKVRNRTSHSGYKDYYNKRTKNIVYKKYEKDFEIFNYEF